MAFYSSEAINSPLFGNPLFLTMADSPFTPLVRNTFICAASGAPGTLIIQLFPATGSGFVVVIKKIDVHFNPVRIIPDGNDTIDGSNLPRDLRHQSDVHALLDAAPGVWMIWS